MNKTNCLILSASRENEKIRFSAYEKTTFEQNPLIHYEENRVSLPAIERLCRNIVFILNKANKRGDVDPDILNELKKAGQYLYDELLTPRAKHSLRSTKADTLIVSIDDQLVQVPWELLYDGNNFLCLRFSMGRIVSTRQTIVGITKREHKDSLTMLIISDPQNNLNSAYKEGVAIRDYLSEADEAIKANLVTSKVDTHYVKENIRDYDIVHYAGHSDYIQHEPSSSGWMLSDGKLASADITKMSGGAPFPFLVFSNACHSGRTDEWHIQEGYEEHVYGLANAFLLSGVTHYIGTFWTILDSPGSYIAAEFYKALSRNVPIGEALRMARKNSIEQFSEKNIIWASYMLYGDPAFSLSDITAPTEQPKSSDLEEKKTHVMHDMGGARSANGQTAEKPKKTYSKTVYGLIALIAVILISFGIYWSNITDRAGTQPSPQPPATADPLQLSMNIIGQREDPKGDVSEVIIREGGVLQSYDNFQVHFSTNKDAHVYLLIFDSENNAKLLFPDPKIQLGNKVKGYVDYVVPSMNQWFWLDENIGTETLYLLASEKPLDDIQDLLDKMEKAGAKKKADISGQIKNKIRSLERGVGGITQGKMKTFHLKNGKTVQHVAEVVQGTGAAVRAISFRHVNK
ncbi:MAG TPA: CHAT domain-containing protein [Syntrophorhabdaceae bacterium]|nr:CHAT domain-containing protein [Syntrophorhabdaceae bacterium]